MSLCREQEKCVRKPEEQPGLPGGRRGGGGQASHTVLPAPGLPLAPSCWGRRHPAATANPGEGDSCGERGKEQLTNGTWDSVSGSWLTPWRAEEPSEVAAASRCLAMLLQGAWHGRDEAGRDGLQGPERVVPTCGRLPGDIPAIPTRPWGNELGRTSLGNPISPPPPISIFPLEDFNRARSVTPRLLRLTPGGSGALWIQRRRGLARSCAWWCGHGSSQSHSGQTGFVQGDDGIWFCAFTGRISVSEARVSFQRVSYDSVCQLTVPFAFA